MSTQKLPRLLAPLALGAALCALPAQLEAVTLNATLQFSLTVYDNAVDGVTDGVGDGNQANASSFSIGKLDDSTYNRLERGILTFSLPAVPAGEELVSATLKLYVRTSGVSGNASVYHSQTLSPTSGTNAIYSDPGYTNFAGYIATPATGGTSSVPVLTTLDVTQWVLSDYQFDTGSISSSFRLQIDGIAFTETNTNNRYSFVGKNTNSPTAGYDAYIPVLELTFASASPIPEPSTAAALVGAIGLGLAACARRRPRP